MVTIFKASCKGPEAGPAQVELKPPLRGFFYGWLDFPRLPAGSNSDTRTLLPGCKLSSTIPFQSAFLHSKSINTAYTSRCHVTMVTLCSGQAILQHLPAPFRTYRNGTRNKIRSEPSYRVHQLNNLTSFTQLLRVKSSRYNYLIHHIHMHIASRYHSHSLCDAFAK